MRENLENFRSPARKWPIGCDLMSGIYRSVQMFACMYLEDYSPRCMNGNVFVIACLCGALRGGVDNHDCNKTIFMIPSV